MYMKAGDPFTGYTGTQYVKDGEVEHCDMRIAFRCGWSAVDVPEVIPDAPVKDAKKP